MRRFEATSSSQFSAIRGFAAIKTLSAAVSVVTRGGKDEED